MPLDRKRPLFAKPWQLAILKKMYEENNRPSAAQRLELVAETGLDKTWIRKWFERQASKVPNSRGGPVSRRPETMQPETMQPETMQPETTQPDMSEKFLIHHDETNPDLSLLEDTVEPAYDEPGTFGPSSSHHIWSQETSNMHPEYDELLASLTAQPGEVDHVWVETPHILAPTPHRILPACDWHSLGYIPASSTSRLNSRPPLEEELTQSAPPQHTNSWSYSRDPLHGRYPEFSEFYSPAAYDVFQYGARLPGLSSMDSSPTMDNPSSSLGIDYTTGSLEYIHAATQPSIATSVSLPASWLGLSHMDTPQVEQASDMAQDPSSPGHI